MTDEAPRCPDCGWAMRAHQRPNARRYWVCDGCEDADIYDVEEGPALADTKPAPRPSACRQCGGSRRIRVPVSRVASVVVVCGECAG